MEGEVIPESLLEAYRRDADGGYRVRRFYGKDIAVVVFGMLGTLAVFVLTAVIVSAVLEL